MKALLYTLVAGPALMAAATSGSGLVTGTVRDEQGHPVPGAVVALEHRITGHRQTAVTDKAGRFALRNVPFNDYHLEARAPGLTTAHKDVSIRSGLPVETDLRLAAAGAVVVVEEEADLIEDHPSSHVDFDRATIAREPAAVASRALESAILATPGFIQDENGRFHFRGSHGQVMYVIDGVPVTDQMQAAFSNSLDPGQVDAMEVVTGGISAEYGGKPGAVVNLTSRSGLGTPGGFQGEVSAGASRFSTYEAGFALRGSTDRMGWFATASGSTSDRYLDPVNFDNFHNHGTTGRVATRFDWLLTDHDTLRVSASGGSTSREVANLASQEALGQDQRARTTDANLSVGWTRLLDGGASLETVVFARRAGARLDPTSGQAPDPLKDFPVWASQDRTLDNLGASVAWQGKDALGSTKAGLQYTRFPLRERFAFAVTDDAMAPAGDPLHAYTPAGGGSIFRFDESHAPVLASAYVQREIRTGGWNLGLGLRYDSWTFRGDESHQLQPRIALSYSFPGSSTLVRVSYDRLLITPENENLAMSTSQATWDLAGGAGTVPALRPEIQDSWLVGVERQLGAHLKATLDYWWKVSRNSADSDQFYNTGIVFPVAAARGRFHGMDLRLDLAEIHGFSGYLSAGTVRTVFRTPTVGGLSGAEGSDGPAGQPYLIDHDEKLNVQLGLRWQQGSFFAQAVGRYDSGLVAGEPGDVAGNPDYAFGIPYVRVENDRLVGPVYRIRPRTVWNVNLGRTFPVGAGRTLQATASLLNVFDEKGLYNFLSTFGGTHVIPPRTLALGLKYSF